MRKLNKKGFTLIELLAVIVVLAIVLVVTIPNVLSSMDTARKKQFDNAKTALQTYLTGQISSCKLGDTSLVKYETSLFDDNCSLKVYTEDDLKKLFKAAGYTYQQTCDKAKTDFCGNIATETTSSGALKFSSTSEVNIAATTGVVSKIKAPAGGKFGAQG